MRILDKLWEGELYPAARSVKELPGYSRCLREAALAEERLLEALSPEAKTLLEEYRAKHMTLSSLLEQDAFAEGFRMAGLFLLDILEGVQ